MDITRDTGDMKIMPGLYQCPICFEMTPAGAMVLEPLRPGKKKRRKVCKWCNQKLRLKYGKW